MTAKPEIKEKGEEMEDVMQINDEALRGTIKIENNRCFQINEETIEG